MKNNILKTLSNNLGFKILAVALAFLLWLTVYNIEDPTKTVAYTVSVTVENKDYVYDIGKYFEIEEGSQKVSFSVTAPRSVLDKLDASDFVAVADMSNLTIDDDGTSGTVPVEITCTTSTSDSSMKLSSTTKSIKVTIEDLMTKQFVVTAKTTGAAVDGYALGEVAVTAPNVLKVSGPASIVERIVSVVATVNIDDMSDSGTYKATPVLLDKNGKEIDATKLTLDSAYVTVSTEILNTKEVTIAITPTGTPASGYVVTSTSSEPTTITLKGSKAVLNSINSIEIPSDLISVSGAKSDVTATIDITEYLPEGVSLVNAEDANLEITVAVDKIKEKTYTINTNDITVSGLPTGCEIQFELSSVAVTVSGLESDIDKLDGAVDGYIDVTGLSVGTHQVDLILVVDDDIDYEPVKVTVKIIDSTEE